MIEVTKESVEEVLKEFRKLIDENRYQLESGKDNKNYEFTKKYALTPCDEKRMLKQIIAENCINVEQHHKDKSKVVYKFVQFYDIDVKGKTENIPVYIKFFIGYVSCQKNTVIIIFHEPKYRWKYMFK